MDDLTYYGFTRKSRLDKAINSFIGIISGISIDGKINQQELAYLIAWIKENENLKNRHPMNELLPIVAKALEDGIISDEERLDLQWLCERMISTDYYNQVTADIQRLHAIVGGIAADNIITEEELNNLSSWMDDHQYLRTCYPYDELDSLITAVLADKKIDPQEHQMLLAAFKEFVTISDKKTISKPLIIEQQTIIGLCAVCPEIKISQSLFCFTGASSFYTRDQFIEIITDLGGRVVNNVSKNLNYLIIGAAGNPCWAYACYGRKVESAVNLRKQGYRILLVHENDFRDVILDQSH